MLQKVEQPQWQGNQPHFSFAQFFGGETLANGVIESRFGATMRSFEATFRGKWQGDTFQLHESFLFSDGQTDERVWVLQFNEAGNFFSDCAETVGQGRGIQSRTGCRHQYRFRLPIGALRIVLHIDETYYAFEPGNLLYRARMKKYGLLVGTIFISFRKP